MQLTEILSISGMPGLYRLVANRSNGLIVESLSGDSKRKFVSARKYQFAPLESISLYVLGDTINLSEVFLKMKESESSLKPPHPKDENHVIFEYFEQVVPNYDEDLVKLRDIRKIIKWYMILQEEGLLEDSNIPAAEEE